MIKIEKKTARRYLAEPLGVLAQFQIDAAERDFVERCVLQASETLERFVGRTLARAKIRERFWAPNMRAGDGLVLAAYPIVSVVQVKVDGLGAIDLSGVDMVAAEGGILRWLDGSGVRWYSGDIEVVYVAGWVGYYAGDTAPPVDGELNDGAPNVPADVERIVADLAGIFYDDRKRNLLRVSESEGDVSVSYRAVDEFLVERAGRLRSLW